MDETDREDSSAVERASDWIVSHFSWSVAAIALMSLALRLTYLVVAGSRTSNDGTFYHEVAGSIADGRGYEYLGVPTAYHPPAWPVLLAVGSRVGLRSVYAHQVIASMVGVTTVVLVAIVARRLAGPRAGLIAAALAGVFPGLWMYEHALAAETLAIPMTAVILLLAYRLMERVDLRRGFALGVGIGVLALVRSEQLVLVVVLAIPIVVIARHVDLRRALMCLVAVAVGALLVISPWFLYNVGRFDHPVLLSTQLGALLIESNCDRTYAGSELGYFDIRCNFQDSLSAKRVRPSGDPTSLDLAFRADAMHYVRRHLGRLPVVVLAREARVLGLFHPSQQVRLDGTRSDAWVVWAAFVGFWILVPAAAFGTVTLRRRRVRTLPLWAIIGIVFGLVAVTFGFTRFRAPADVAILILAGVGLDALLSHVSGRSFTDDRDQSAVDAVNA